MPESVCLQCGAELQYDWAPCPDCGWKAPETWETGEEEETAAPRGVLSKPRKWIKVAAWAVLAAAATGIFFYLFR